MTIRNAEIQDAATIAVLSGQLGYEASDLLMQNRLNLILKDPSHCVFVGVEDEKVIGWIHGCYSLRLETDFFVEVAGLVVDEKHRKKGMGKVLIDEVISWAKSFNCDRLRVRCNVKRLASHKFYRHLGFELKKEQKIFDKPITQEK